MASVRIVLFLFGFFEKRKSIGYVCEIWTINSATSNDTDELMFDVARFIVVRGFLNRYQKFFKVNL